MGKVRDEGAWKHVPGPAHAVPVWEKTSRIQTESLYNKRSDVVQRLGPRKAIKGRDSCSWVVRAA